MKGMMIFLSMILLFHITTTNAQPESSLQTCNSCCQGPAGSQGTPGIPGVPGTNGMPGNLGPRGDRGDSVKGDSVKGDRGESVKGNRGESVKGDRGESVKGDIGETGSRGVKGDSGSLGLKGESGTGLPGLPGKTGPMGVAGLVGSPGLSGVKGQKGQMGQNRVSAFTAVRNSPFTSSSADQALPFQIIRTNVGEDFDMASGRFTCEIPGIYSFTYNLFTQTGDPLVFLMQNNQEINSVYRTSETFYDAIGNAAVLQLAAGDQVWLKCRHSGKMIFSNINIYSTFAGVLIHEI